MKESQGAFLEEALTNIKEAIELYLKTSQPRSAMGC
jgi:predicted RNase H-like HicB family nuclease